MPTKQPETLPTDSSPDPPLCLVGLVGGRPLTAPLPRVGIVSLGRGDEAKLRVDHPTVSRVHAVVRRASPEDVACEVEDMGSRNGTRVAGRSVVPGQPTLLRLGEVLEIGSVGLILQVHQQTVPRGRAALPGRPMQALHALADRVAMGDINVLLLGETGVGKEVLSSRLHAASARAQKPFVRLNCAAMPEALLESELFGHERGAFTGAVSAKPGLLHVAHGGTVLLDEVGDMPRAVQAKLLRVIDERCVLPIGGTTPRSIDVRFLSATNTNLNADVAAGRFRQDLYYRLAAVTLRVPPLRERLDELPELASLFASKAAERGERSPPKITEPALDRLLAHSWPGNIRELKNVIERAELLRACDSIDAEDLAFELTPPAEAAGGAAPNSGVLRQQLSDIERERIKDALASCAGNQSAAARLLGMPRATLVKRLIAFGLPRPRKTET